MRHTKGMRWLAGMMCAMMLLAAAPITAMADEKLDGLTGRYEELEAEQREIQQQLKETTSEKDKQQAIRNQLTAQITTTQKQIKVLGEKISYLENEIKDKTAAIAALEEEVIRQQDLFMKRIRSIYKSSVGSNMLGMVFGLDSFGSYLSYGKYLSVISEHDSSLLDTLGDNIAELNALRESLRADEEALASTKKTAEGKKATLTGQRTEVDNALQDIKKQEQEYLADLEANKAAMAQIQADIDAIYAAAGGSGSKVDYSTTGFIYPLAGYRAISSYYGWRFGGTDFHTGIDFPAPCNTPIRASASGTVIFVRTGMHNNTRSEGYGNYIIIDHGGGYSTLYGHCNSVAVSVGESVTKGETIGYVGTTGWSTGYHLHFEIRINGKATNPLNYL